MKPKDLFRAICVVLLTTLSATGLFAQIYGWSDPAPASDSVTDNRNAILKDVLYNGDFTYLLFWERSEDPGSTSIYCRNIYEMDEPFPVVSGQNFHCTNPRIIETSYDNDTLFYLFYESDQNGNSDIYYTIYTLNGFTEPVLFAGSASDESHFRCNINGFMAWKEGDKIKTARLYRDNSPFTITIPVTLDSSGCSMPDVSLAYDPHYVVWHKQQNDSSYIMMKYWDGSLPGSILYRSSVDITSLKFAAGSCSDESEVISWENVDNGFHTIHALSLYSNDEFVSFFEQEGLFSPSMAIYYIPVETFYESGILTFIYGSEQDNDVYINEDAYQIPIYIWDYYNFSSSPYLEANPIIFQGKYTDIDNRDMFLIWESSRNEHWQLFFSFTSIYCGGGINEQEMTVISGLNIFPNPVKNACDINYSLSERSTVSIQLCSTNGKQVTLMDQTIQEKGDQVFRFDFERILPGNIFAGVYLIKVQAGNNLVSGKIIRVN
jgi:hypothetical protein